MKDVRCKMFISFGAPKPLFRAIKKGRINTSFSLLSLKEAKKNE